jgi:hypothetical protein
MGFRSSRRSQTQETEAGRQTARHRQSTTQQEFSTGAIWTTDTDRAEQHFGMQIPDDRTLQRLQIAEDTHGPQVHDWVDEGMPAEILGKTRDMEAFRQRQAERPSEVPTNIERQNKRSVQRSEKAAVDTGAAGETGVPEPVRDVLSSTGRSLDASIQRAMEDRMGDSFGDVQIHTGSTAAAACESINARAFTVGSHIAFNSGEYDPESPEGQHVLAHELAHVRQQTGGAVSMLPQEDMELEVDPDPALEREAEETAQQVMQGGELGIQRMADTEVHVQRFGGIASSAVGMAETAYNAFKQSKQAQKDQQQARADSFGSMGSADGDIEGRVAALEDDVSQLGSYVAEQVAPEEGLRDRLTGAVSQEGAKEGLKITAGGLLTSYTALKTKDPEFAMASAMTAQAGVETLSSQAQYAGPMVPDIGSGKLGDIKSSIEEMIDKHIRQRINGPEFGGETKFGGE